MNPELPHNPQHELEARLTALLLGELSAGEAAAVREAIRKDAQLARLYAQLQATISLVRESAASPAEQPAPQPAPLKLSADRRQKLLAHFKTITPKEFAKPPKTKTRLFVEAAAVAAVLMLLAAIALPNFIKARTTSQRTTIINNLRVIDGAKQQWAIENHKTASAEPTFKEIKPYLGGNENDPNPLPAVAGETYKIGKVGEPSIAMVGPDKRISLPGSESRFAAAQPSDSTPAAEMPAPVMAPPPALPAVPKTDIYLPSAAPESNIALTAPAQKEPVAQSNAFTFDDGVSQAHPPLGPKNSISGLPLSVGTPGIITASVAGSGNAAPSAGQRDRFEINGNGPDYDRLISRDKSVSEQTFGPNRANGALSGSLAISGAAGTPPAYELEAVTNGAMEFPVATGTPESHSTTLNYATAAPTAAVQVAEARTGGASFAFNDGEISQSSSARTPLRLPAAPAAVSPQTVASPSEYSGTAAGDNIINQGNLATNSISSDSAEYQNARKRVDSLDQKIHERIYGMAGSTPPQVDSGKAKTNAPIKAADAPLPKPAAAAPIPQPEILTRENAFSTFSLNVSDVSFKLAAAALQQGHLPDQASIRSEEFINAFDYRDPAPAQGLPFAFAAERAQYPFAHNRDLLRFSLKTAATGRQANRPLNLVLLLDNSGSMERADRVRIIHEALRVLAAQLRPQDRFSIVAFARTAQLRADGVPGNEAAAAADNVSRLTPQGGTNLGDALGLAYATALRHYLADGDNRVVLMTDGAANLGDVDSNSLEHKVENYRRQGVALDCFGIGWEGYNDDLLEVLTRHADGRYGFINTPEEAVSGFAAQLAGALNVAASDVKVQVEFNTNRVIAWRQIGYAKHQLTKEQFRDNNVNAAQIAAAESGNALYVIETNPQGDGPIATVRVRYRVPGTRDYREHSWDVAYSGSAPSLEQTGAAMRLAAAGSAFSEWLAASPYAADVTPDRLLRLLRGVPETYGADPRPKQLEWMIRQAQSLSGK